MSSPYELALTPAPTLSDIEAAIIARLNEQRVRNGGPLKLIEPYQGQLIQWGERRGFDGPAVLVHFDTAENAPKSVNGWDEQLTVQFFCGVDNYRSSTAARAGAASGLEPGAYALIQLVFALFAGWDLDIAGVKPLYPQSWHSIIAPEARVDVPFAVYRYDFGLDFHRPRPTAADVQAAATHLLTATTLDISGGPSGDDEGTADLDFQTNHPAS